MARFRGGSRARGGEGVGVGSVGIALPVGWSHGRRMWYLIPAAVLYAIETDSRNQNRKAFSARLGVLA
jgi:hypothetical protein